MKQDFYFSMNRGSVAVGLMEVYVVQSKNWIMMNVRMTVKN